MADNRIDKSLPNVTPEVIPPKTEDMEVDVTEVEETTGPV